MSKPGRIQELEIEVERLEREVEKMQAERRAKKPVGGKFNPNTFNGGNVTWVR